MANPLAASRKVISGSLALFNKARLGFPTHAFVGAGGIGDDLLCTTAFRELKKRGDCRIIMLSKYGGLFENNPDVDAIIRIKEPMARLLHHGLRFTQLGYAAYDPVTDSDAPLTEHILVKICRAAGISGSIGLRPYLFLTPAELAAGKLFERQIVVQSSGLGSPHPVKNKEWFPARFQSVCDSLASQASIIQLGSATDPLMQGARDLRGKTNFRESAAILANALVFIGLESFLMHLARAVDCRSAIVYGGRLCPWQIGYSANANLTGPTPCSPCWLRNTCAYDHECMRMISAPAVLDAALAQIARCGTPLETESAIL